MKRVTLDGERGHFGVCDVDNFGVPVRVDLTAHCQASLCGGTADQLDNNLVADQ